MIWLLGELERVRPHAVIARLRYRIIYRLCGFQVDRFRDDGALRARCSVWLQNELAELGIVTKFGFYVMIIANDLPLLAS